jgi:hypothetical protein
LAGISERQSSQIGMTGDGFKEHEHETFRNQDEIIHHGWQEEFITIGPAR